LTNIIFFGPPGAGKGTQAKNISDFLKLHHLSTGEILRLKILQKDELGLRLKDIMASGKLVSDDILNEIVAEKIVACKNIGFILDGYPRTLNQSQFLEKILKKNSLKLNYIFNINISFDTLKNRIINRSKEEGREDDNLDAIKIRYDAYLQTTTEVSSYYSSENPEIFFDIDGSDQIEEITNKIKKIIVK
tara:strand:+ start:722 stop:1291 length:570 start_codon:yes stop_codon:yes gene_type:complete